MFRAVGFTSEELRQKAAEAKAHALPTLAEFWELSAYYAERGTPLAKQDTTAV